MPSTAMERRHLALPDDEDLDAALSYLDDAIEALGHVAFRLGEFHDLQEEPGGGMMFTNSHRQAPETFDVPTLEQIGKLFVFGKHVERKLTELDEYVEELKSYDGSRVSPSFEDMVEWLDVVRKAGRDGTVVRDEGR